VSSGDMKVPPARLRHTVSRVAGSSLCMYFTVGPCKRETASGLETGLPFHHPAGNRPAVSPPGRHPACRSTTLPLPFRPAYHPSPPLHQLPRPSTHPFVEGLGKSFSPHFLPLACTAATRLPIAWHVLLLVSQYTHIHNVHHSLLPQSLLCPLSLGKKRK
jgi:hypothetical protein